MGSSFQDRVLPCGHHGDPPQLDRFHRDALLYEAGLHLRRLLLPHDRFLLFKERTLNANVLDSRVSKAAFLAFVIPIILSVALPNTGRGLGFGPPGPIPPYTRSEKSPLSETVAGCQIPE